MGDDSRGQTQCAKVLPQAEHLQHKVINLRHARVMTTWEPSNGVVFASKTRPTARDRTWSPSNDIPFAGTPLNKAHYATKRPPVKPSAATVRPAETAPARMPYKAVNTAAKLARPPAPKPYTAPTKAAPASLRLNAKARAGALNLASRPIDAEETRRLSEEAKRRTLEAMKAKELAEEQKRKAEAERQRLAEVARAARVVEITSDFQRKTSQFEEAIRHIREEYLAVEDEIQEATLEHRDALGLYSGRKSVLSPNFHALTRHKVKGLARRAREIKRELEEERLEAKRLAAVQERLASLPQPSPDVVKLATWMDGVTELVTDVKAKGEAEERAEGRKSYDDYRTVFEPLSPNVYAIIKDIETLCELFKRQEDKYKDLSKGMDSRIVELVTLRGSYRWATGIVKLIDNATLVSAGMKLDFEELHGWQRRCRELWQQDKQHFQESLYDIMATAHQSRRLTRQIRYNLDPLRGYPECWQIYNFDIAWMTQNENIKLSHEDLRLAVNKLREWQPRTLEDRSKAYKSLFECWDKCEMFHRISLRPRLINLVEENGIVNHIRLSWMANNAPLSEVERYRGVYLFLPVQSTADAILRFQRDILTSTRQEGSWLRKSTLWRKIDRELRDLAFAIAKTRPDFDAAHQSIFRRARLEDSMGLLEHRAADLRAFVRNRLPRVKERSKERIGTSRKVPLDRATTRLRNLLAARRRVEGRSASKGKIVKRRSTPRRVEASPNSAQAKIDTITPTSKRIASSEVRRAKSLPGSTQSIVSDSDTNPTPSSAKRTASQEETAPRHSNPKASSKARKMKSLPTSRQSASTGNNVSLSPTSTQSNASDNDSSPPPSKYVASTNVRLKKYTSDKGTSSSPSSTQSAASQNATSAGPSKRTAARKTLRKKLSSVSVQTTESKNESSQLSTYRPLNLKPTSSKQAPHGIMHSGSTSLGYAVEEGHCDDFASEQQSDCGELHESPGERNSISEQESASDELYETASEGPESSRSEEVSDEGSESESESNEEEHVPLSYQIPTEDLRNAMQASRSSGAAFWHYRLYRDPEGQAVRVHYCKNKEQTERVAALFADKNVLGFDLEWKPNCFPRDGIKNSVSLIQIATEDRIALFHIAVHRGDTADELLAPALRQILESRAITKVGVNVRGDYARLRDVFGINPQGYLELSHLYRVVKFSESQPEKVNKVLVALATQVEEHLQLPLSKGPVRASDWSKDLTMEQQQYAASDAYAGFRLFDVLEAKRKQIKPTPPRPAFHELNLPISVPVRSVRVIPTRMAAQAQPPVVQDDASDADSEDSDIAAVPSQVLTAKSQDTCFIPATASSENVTTESSAAQNSNVQPPSTVNVRLVNQLPRSLENTSQQTSERPLEVKTAEAWVQTWRASLPANYQPKASLTNLRAYSLWHCQALDVEIVAAKLRDPPLAMTTVSLYVLESVRMEGLPFDAGRLRSVLDILPQHVAQGRYRALWRKLQ